METIQLQFEKKSAQNLYKQISTHDGPLLCYFMKKDGSERRMVFTFNLKEAIKTNNAGNWSPIARGFLPVFDIEKGEARLVNLSKVRYLKRIPARTK